MLKLLNKSSNTIQLILLKIIRNDDWGKYAPAKETLTKDVGTRRARKTRVEVLPEERSKSGR